MNKYLKIIFLTFLFSCVFSITFIKIEPNSVTLGDEVEFTLTVNDYDSEVLYVYLSNYINLYLKKQNDGLYKSNNATTIQFHNIKSLNNFTTNIYYKGNKTDLTVDIKIPTEIKLLYFSNNSIFYNYGISKLSFSLNYNKLYNTNVLIEFGNNIITNCTAEEYNIVNLICYYEFSTQKGGDKLNLKFNGKETNYSITLYTPKEFSKIYLDKYKFYISSTEQIIISQVDSSYKIDEHEIVLVSSDSNNSNITLTSCKHYNTGILYVQCSAILNALGNHYVFVDNKNSSFMINIFPKPTSICKVLDIEPSTVEVPTETKFILKVDYIANLDKAIFTLVYRDNKIYLTNCLKVEDKNDEITCTGTLKEPGEYDVYLNGIKQFEQHVYAFSQSLTKAFDIYYNYKYKNGNVIKFDSPTTSYYIEIEFDSINDSESKNISLKGTNNVAKITINSIHDHPYQKKINYTATFPNPDTYYLYIENVKQNVSITVTNEPFTPFTSEVTAIFPTSVVVDDVENKGYIDFILTVDTNLGISKVDIKLINANKSWALYCKADPLNKQKVICQEQIEREGEYHIVVDGKEFPNVKVIAKSISKLDSFFPNSIFPSFNPQTIVINFVTDISNFVDKVKFVNIENLEELQGTCSLLSNNILNCSAVFEKEGDYYITINDFYYRVYIHVNEEDNIIINDRNSDEQSNIIEEEKIEDDNDSDNIDNNNIDNNNNNNDNNNNNNNNNNNESINYIKISPLLLTLILLI